MPYLPIAVESVLNQTFRDFEFIIINDCSTDQSVNYLNSLADPRIVRIENQTNQGVCQTLRTALHTAKGQYIARLDADDIARIDRLEKQVSFLDTYSHYGLIGSCCKLIDEEGQEIKTANAFIDDLELRWKMLFKNPFKHSSVMFRRSLIEKYNLTYEKIHGEDYYLWKKMLEHTEACILREPLIDYRVHQKSWTFTKKEGQSIARLEQSFNSINELMIDSGRNPLIWENYLVFAEWYSKPADKNGVDVKHAKLLGTLICIFSQFHKKNKQLKVLQYKVIKRIYNYSPWVVYFKPSLFLLLIKLLIRENLEFLKKGQGVNLLR